MVGLGRDPEKGLDRKKGGTGIARLCLPVRPMHAGGSSRAHAYIAQATGIHPKDEAFQGRGKGGRGNLSAS